MDSTKFTQEIRLTAPLGPRVEWLIGGFYNDEDATQHQHILAANFTSGVPAGELAFFDFPNTFEEYAAFTDFTFEFSDRFDVQIGGRYSRNEQTLTQTNIGPIFPGGIQTRPEIVTEDDSFTYLLTPRVRLSPDLMMYARLASGYRPGGPNTNAALGVPAQFGPDQTESYEIGFKGSVFDKVLSFDASLYHIDWKDIQISLQEPIIRAGYKANAGRATSHGMDLSLEARPLAGLAILVWGAWNIAELAEPLPATSTVRGASGDRLPFSSRFSSHISLEQQFNLSAATTGFVSGSVSYVGERKAPFVGATQNRATLPSYSKIDFRAGIERESWTANFFINNISDKRAVLNADATMISYVQPRTFGVALSKSY